jgi:hypothetical protein
MLNLSIHSRRARPLWLRCAQLDFPLPFVFPICTLHPVFVVSATLRVSVVGAL